MHKTQSDSSTERLMHRKLLYCVYCVDDQWMSHVTHPAHSTVARRLWRRIPPPHSWPLPETTRTSCPALLNRPECAKEQLRS